MATKRQLIDKFDERLGVDYGDGYTAYAERREAYATRDLDPATGADVETYHPAFYAISYHKGLMPAFDETPFKTIGELLAAMRKIALLSH